MFSDLRYAFRELLKSTGFTAVVVLSLGLAIGANTALFGVVYALVLRPLPVPEPEGLRFVNQQKENGHPGFSYPAYRHLSEQGASLATVAAFVSISPAMVSVAGGALESLDREYVSASYFDVLGLAPAAGRFFAHAEDTSEPSFVIIGYKYWERAFSRSPAAIGATLNRDGRPFTIVGVAPRGFSGVVPERHTQLWFPISANMWRNGRYDPAWGVNDHTNEWYRLLARLKPAVSASEATAAFGAFNQAHLQTRAIERGESDASRLLSRGVTLSSAEAGYSAVGQKLMKPFTVLLVLVALLVVLASLNLGNMLFVRARARARELAIRLAIGAGRAHLVRLMLTESLLLTLLGGAAGHLVALWGGPALVAVYGLTVNVSPDSRVFAYTGAVSVLAGLIAGLVPAIQASRSNLSAALKGSDSPAQFGRWHMGRLMVAAQVAFSLVLLAGAVLFGRNLGKLHSTPMGFERSQMVLFDVVPAAGGAGDNGESTRRLMERLRQLPGVTSVGAGRDIPSSAPPVTITVEGYSPQPGESMEVEMRDIAGGYLETLQTPLLAGRSFEERDCRKDAAKVAVVSASLARRFFGDANPLGRRVGTGAAKTVEIVGVVADAKLAGPKAQTPPQLFVPAVGQIGSNTTILLRTSTDPGLFMATLPAFVQDAAPDVRMFRLHTLEQAIDTVIAQDRMLAGLSGFFGLLALLLATLGVFGVVSHAVNQRTKEIAIRIALGARRENVLASIVGETLVLLGLGLALGLGGAITGERLVASLLFETPPGNPTTFATATAALCIAALLACWLPAWRATRVSPVVALRSE